MTDAEIAAPDMWDRLNGRMAALADDYQHAAEAEGDLDAGWRALMRSLVDALADQADDREVAVGIIAEALQQVSADP